jgi:hypothetical protein
MKLHIRNTGVSYEYSVLTIYRLQILALRLSYRRAQNAYYDPSKQHSIVEAAVERYGAVCCPSWGHRAINRVIHHAKASLIFCAARYRLPGAPLSEVNNII